MGLFSRKPARETSGAAQSPASSQVESMIRAGIPVFLSNLHADHPPRWVTVRGDRLESVTGLESAEYMADSSNHGVWSVDHFVGEFPFVVDFLNMARPGQSGFFVDQTGDFTIEDD